MATINKVFITGFTGFGGSGKIMTVDIEVGNGIFKEVVIKCVSASKDYGLRSISEVYIEKYLQCPGIPDAVKCVINDSGELTFYMKKAISTISDIYNNPAIKKETKKRWMILLLDTIKTLHTNGILHGDIKASNILLYDDKSVKLADYGLSVLIPNAETGTIDLPGIISYTNSHRAPEIVEKKIFSFPADIWALGCTLYEIYYGQLLFLDQKKEEAKETYEKFLRNGIPPNKNHMWKHKDNSLFNDLIFSILKIEPNERPNIWDIYKHPFFGLVDVEEKVSYPIFTSKYVLDNFYDYTDDINVIYLASHLYVISNYKMRTCFIIAHKFFYKKMKEDFIYNEQDLLDEMELCRSIDFDFKIFGNLFI